MRTVVRFYLGNERIEIGDFDPQTTVLQWLRNRQGRSGTKEGCAEGDCGACTVLVGRLVGAKIRYRAVNACIQPVATLDGSHVITVEDVAYPSGKLHPVQQAMVDNHGSQCGFCTPGFVMSLLARYREREDLRHWQDEDVLAGNLCRCTGYGPILAAAEAMRQADEADPHPFAEDMAAKLGAMVDDRDIEIVFGQRRFLAPASLDRLFQTIEAHQDATLIAGSTDVGLWITKQHRDLGTQIWLGRVAELTRVREVDDIVEIGAMTTYSDSYEIVAKYYPDAGELWRRIGSVQIRNAGTIGGNIANGSPIGDTPPFLIAIGAKLRLRSASGSREIEIADYFVDYGKQDRGRDEIVEAILLPKPEPNWRFRAYKVSKRFDQDISALCAAFHLHIEDGQVRAARIAFGGMAATPKRAQHTEQALIGQLWQRDTVEIAAAMLANDFTPISDMRASADYRLQCARNLMLKCFIETQSAVRIRLANGAGHAA